MHRFLTAFFCLSTLAMTQNVVAGTPTPLPSRGVEAVVQGAETAGLAAGSDFSRAGLGGEVPSPGTMLLLVTGLAGLSAVGNRRPVSIRAASR